MATSAVSVRERCQPATERCEARSAARPATPRRGAPPGPRTTSTPSHNLTIPWKPSELEQRDGRIVRQGNIFPEVYICNYVTEGSFDAYQWQTIESKARFISQIMAGEVTARTAEDVDQLVVTAAQIKAIASGNPQILQKVAVEVELTKLERLYSAWSANRRRLRWQKESLPPHLDSVAREIAGHQKAIATRDQNEYDKFTIELRRDVSSEEAIAFTDRGRAGAHLRQLCFAVDRESRSRGAGAKVIGCYRGFEVVVRASGRQFDTLSALFSETDLFLRAGENELNYGVNLGESDAGVMQSMDAQLRGLEGKLEKSLAEQSELEHRRRQIEVELTRGFGHAARYEELKLRLDALNQELTSAGVEIEASPELSNLDEDAFSPVEPGVSVHRIFSLAEQTVEPGAENAVALGDRTPIVSESPVVESECVTTVAAEIRLAHNDDETDQACIRAETESASKNGLFTQPERDHSENATAIKRGASSKSALAKGVSQQMSFDWS